MAKEVRYKAEFSPRRLVGGNAFKVSPLGPATWECTAFLLNPPRWAPHRAVPEILEQLDRPAERYADDIDGVLCLDPAAPAWVRAWAGPFTVTVYPLREGDDLARPPALDGETIAPAAATPAELIRGAAEKLDALGGDNPDWTIWSDPEESHVNADAVVCELLIALGAAEAAQAFEAACVRCGFWYS